jgi:hypothetical protein
MSNQSSFPVTPAAGLAAEATNPADDSSTDQGVPVGADDVQADKDRASGESGDDSGEGDGGGVGGIGGGGNPLVSDLTRGQDEDDGVPVGDADVDADRQRASDEGGAQ